MPLDPALIARLKSLELRAQRVVDGYASGLHQNPARGFSVEFAQHREYAPGDDLRYLDWRQHARSDRYHLKEFESETDFSGILLIDTSESMDYRSPEASWSKLDCARTLAAAITLVLARQRDSVGLMLFDERLTLVRPPSSKPAHVKELIGQLDGMMAHGSTNLALSLKLLADRLKRRSVVLLFSDLFADPADLSRGLKRLAHRRHDVRVVQLADPAEVDFPFDEALRFLGSESEPSLAVDSRGIAAAYRQEFAAHCQAVRTICRKLGLSYVFARTDAPPDRLLRDIFSTRQH